MFPLGEKELRIGILGMTEGNGHPYSWSAIFNGFNKAEMAKCPYPVIPVYLGKQPPENFGIPGARITCICCTGWQTREEAERIAAEQAKAEEDAKGGGKKRRGLFGLFNRHS